MVCAIEVGDFSNRSGMYQLKLTKTPCKARQAHDGVTNN
jgi:hypothetical protein